VITMSKRSREADPTIYVGSQKPILDYIPACVRAVKQCGEVIISARGRAISKAVDVAEVLRNRFLDVEVQSIDIGTEELDEGRKVSTIAIALA